MAMEENCKRGNCKEMPPTMKLTIRAAYGSAFLRESNNNKRSAVERIKRAVCHAQARYCHSSSLGTRIQGGSCDCGEGCKYKIKRNELVWTCGIRKKECAIEYVLGRATYCALVKALARCNAAC